MTQTSDAAKRARMTLSVWECDHRESGTADAARCPVCVENIIQSAIDEALAAQAEELERLRNEINGLLELLDRAEKAWDYPEAMRKAAIALIKHQRKCTTHPTPEDAKE